MVSIRVAVVPISDQTPKPKLKPSSTKSSIQNWLRSLRPLAQGNLLLPALFGWSLATDRFDFSALTDTRLVHAVLYSALLHPVIIWTNEWSDAQSDRYLDRATLVSGGSRILVEEKLTTSSVRFAARIATLLFLLFSGVESVFLHQPLLFLLSSAAVFLSWAYSAPPFRLCRHGLGEVLQGLGMGVLLPFATYLIAGGSTSMSSLSKLTVPLSGTFFIAAIGHTITALPDLLGDQKAGKRTLAVRIGAQKSQRFVLSGLLLLAALWPLMHGQQRFSLQAKDLFLTISPLVFVASCCAIGLRNRQNKSEHSSNKKDERFAIWASVATSLLWVFAIVV